MEEAGGPRAPRYDLRHPYRGFEASDSESAIGVLQIGGSWGSRMTESGFSVSKPIGVALSEFYSK